jgi:TPP-dependent pyruvate/acetoin dehydrogenase alpha subunit
MLDTQKRKDMLRQMILVRAFEEKLEELYQRKAMFGSTHSYRGQEAIAVGVCSALESTDAIASYHRGTGHLIAKGADLYTLLCECMGRADGYSKGRGGKMHMGDMSFGFLGNTGTVGGTVPTATGAALAAKVRGSSEVVISFFGEIESWKQKCPIKRLSEKLIQEGRLTAQEFQKMNDVVYAELDEVAKRAEAAPLPKKEVDLTSIYASAEVADG